MCESSRPVRAWGLVNKHRKIGKLFRGKQLPLRRVICTQFLQDQQGQPFHFLKFSAVVRYADMPDDLLADFSAGPDRLDDLNAGATGGANRAID